MENFNVGDVVILKSGGPKMTVTGAERNDDLICKWLDDSGKISMHAFPAAALKKAEGDAPQEWTTTRLNR